MILVDRDIKTYVEKGELFVEGFQRENLGGVSYDLSLDYVCVDDEKRFRYELQPGEVVFIKTIEKIKIPKDVLGRIGEKNSRMRQGLKVDAPYYQPGHVTYVFLRVQNISTSVIELKHGIKIAQIMFEQLCSVPEIPYDAQQGAAFQNEEVYRGLGNYKEEYEKELSEKMERAKQDLEEVTHNIYANVLTIMGIVVAVFALLSINYSAFAEAQLDFKYIITMNLSLTLCIVVLMGIILIFVNRVKSKRFMGIYLGILAVLAFTVIIMGLFIV